MGTGQARNQWKCSGVAEKLQFIADLPTIQSFDIS
jgi:hypothetical protein